MKLEFLANVNIHYPDDSIIRLYDFDEKETLELMNIIHKLIENKNEIVLDKAPFITSSTCGLILRLSNQDIGIKNNYDNVYICQLKGETYLEMIELLKPFSQSNDNTMYQWLYDINTPIDFLYSSSGEW